MGKRLWSARTTLGICLPFLLLTVWYAGIPPALAAQEAPLEREVLTEEKLEIYQPSGRFTESEVTWMLWYLIGVCVLGFLMFAVLRILFHDRSSITLNSKSRGSSTRADAHRAPAESAHSPSEQRYKL